MALIPIFDYKQVSVAQSLKQRRLFQDSQVLFLDNDAYIYARRYYPELDGILFSEIIPEAGDYMDFAETAREIINLLHTLHRQDNDFHDAISPFGNSLLMINELDFIIRRFLNICRIIYVLNRVMLKGKHKKIVMPFSPLEETQIIEEYCISRGIEYKLPFSYKKIFHNILGSKYVVFPGRKKWRVLPWKITGIVTAIFNRIELIRNSRLYKSNSRSGKKVALFLPNEKYLDVLVPVAHSLREKEYHPFIIVPPSVSADEIKNKTGFSVLGVNACISSGIIREGEKIWKNHRLKWREVSKKISSSISDNYEGVNLKQLILQHLDSMIMTSCRQIILILLSSEILSKVKACSLIIFNYREPYARCIIAGANLVGIPVVAVKRGLTVDTPMINTVPVNVLAVSGEYVKSIYVRRGIEPSKIIVTGLPIHDLLIKKTTDRNKIRNKLFSSLGIPSSYRIITYTTQSVYVEYPEDIKAKETNAVFSAVCRIHGAALIVKMHPSERDPRWYKAFIKPDSKEKIFFVQNQYPLDEIILSSDVVVTKFSTTGLDAVVADVPLVLVDFKPASYEIYPYVKEGVALRAVSDEEVLPVIKSILDSKKKMVSEETRNSFLEKHIYKLDGGSAKRISELIISKMIDNSTGSVVGT